MGTKYYDTAQRRQRAIRCYDSNGVETTIISTDERVANYFKPVPSPIDGVGYKRDFDVDGLPILIKYAVDTNNEFYSVYLTTPDVDGIHQPDLEQIALDSATQQSNDISSAIQSHLDNKAKEFRYDNINAIGKYIGYDNVFRLECEALGAWASNCWVVAGTIEAEVLAGTRAMPTVDEAIAELPVYGV